MQAMALCSAYGGMAAVRALTMTAATQTTCGQAVYSQAASITTDT